MKHYRNHMELNAAANAVYAAITTREGIRGWWTQDCEVGDGVGASITVRFGRTFKVMVIKRADPGREVRWLCVDSYLFVPGVIDRKDEWKNHEIVFRLSEPTPGQTVLDFEHIGLEPSVTCYQVCTGGWDQFLASLKAYAETSQGQPFEANTR